jgi:hypothetical protein
MGNEKDGAMGWCCSTPGQDRASVTDTGDFPVRENNPGLVVLPAHDPGAAVRSAPVTSALAE